MNAFRLAALSLATALALSAAPNPEQPMPDRLDLPSALQFALENNFAIRQAREQLNQAEGGFITASAGQLPKLMANAGYLDTSQRIATTPYTQLWNATAQVQQSLYAGGAIRAGVRASRAARTASSLQLQSVTNQVLAGVRTSFYTVLQARETIKVREEALQLLAEELKNAKNRYEAGVGAQFDVLRAEVALANGRPPLIQARNDLRIAMEVMRQILGFTSRSVETLGKVPEFLGTLAYREEKFTLENALITAREKRPELQALAQNVKAAEEAVTIAKAGYQPTLGAFAGWEVERNPYAPHLRDTLDGWSFGLQSSWAIFDGRATTGKVRSARSLADQSRLTLQSQELAIDVDVRRAFATWQEADELVAASNKVVEMAQEALRLARARFDAGAATQLDVLTAQVSLTDASNNQVQAFYADNVAVTQLRAAMGLPDPDVK